MKNRIKLNIYIVLILGTLALSVNGCVSTIQVKPNDHQIRASVERFKTRLGMKFDNEYDARVLTQSLYTFLFFLREQYGLELWQTYVDKVSKGVSPSKAAIDVYQASIYQLGGKMLSVLTKYNPRPFGKMKSKSISHYELVYDAQSGIEKDLPAIEYLLLRHEEELLSYFASTPEMQKRFNIAVSKLVNGKIRLLLLSHKERIERAFGNSRSSALANLGYGVKALNQPAFLYSYISFKYIGLVTTTALVHELTHVIFALTHLDIEQLESISLSDTKGRKAAKALFKKAVGGGGVLSEGFAEYVSEQFNIFWKYKIYDDVDEALRYYLKQKKITIKNHVWPSWLKSGDKAKRSLAYQLSHSYCRFLVNKFGKERFIRLLLSDAHDGAYQAILNVERNEIMHDWLIQLTSKNRSPTALTE